MSSSTSPSAGFLTHLECSRTGERYDSEQLHNLSAAGAPLLARYDLQRAGAALQRHALRDRRTDMWRYLEVLPAASADEVISLAEGWTPLSAADRLGAWAGFRHLFVKDESSNPTGSFKARGLSAAVTAAAARGVRKLAIPTAGNAGGAMAAYAAASGLEAFVFMPRDTPMAFQIECRSFGAHVELVDGLIDDCGRIVGQRTEDEGWFDVSTLKEPYRIEGKKTMGLELAEQLDWELPDVIFYPTGGGTGLIGMWKAFQELKALGWLNSSKMPRMIACQSSGCAPIVNAFESGARFADKFENAETIASGIRVPAAVGDFMILDAVRESGGKAIAINESSIREWMELGNSKEGIAICPETAVCLGALDAMLRSGEVDRSERIVVFNTGGVQKYPEAIDEVLPLFDKSKSVDGASLFATS